MVQIKKNKLALLVIVCILCGGFIGIVATWLISTDAGAVKKVPVAQYKEYVTVYERFANANELLDMVEEKYYIDVDEEQLLRGIYSGMVDGLDDPYSTFYTKEEYENFLVSNADEYEGIGVTFAANVRGYYEIISVTPDSPAEKAGLKAGDIISEVDGKTYEDIDQCSMAIRGKAGTSVTLTIIRDDEQKEFEITRGKIVSESVEYKVLDGNIGYIKLSAFNEDTGSKFKKAVSALEEKKVSGFVLDMRDNGGGLVSQAQIVADELLDEGVIVYLEDRQGNKEYIRSGEGKTNLPYVILVNESSASSTEIVAAAIKDNGGGKLVGTKTYGKGIVQDTMQFKNGTAVKLTVAQYFSPEGNVIHKEGITPDVEVENSGDVDKQLEKAIELLK